MRVLLIEDDDIIADTIGQIIKIIDPSIQIAGHVRSIKAALQWFSENPVPDLIFTDIELEDGKSFDIFKVVSPACLVVFVTSHDNYAIDAFKLNSVDYILKPITKASLESALKKVREMGQLFKSGVKNPPDMQELIKALQLEQRKHRQYRSRFLVKRGQKLVSIPAEEIAYFYSDERVNFLKTKSDQKYILDYTLDELEEMLHPDLFFRISRSFYVSVNSVEHITSYQGNRLQLSLVPTLDKEVIVSREKVTDFKEWLGK